MHCYQDLTAVINSKLPKILFFDTGFFRSLLKGDFYHHLENPESELSFLIKLPFRPFCTPFSFMEWIGLNTEKLPSPTPFNLASVVSEDFLTPAYCHYEQHYAEVQQLDRKNLDNLAATQRNFVCPLMFDI
jgi:hypothetical protein